MRIIRLRPSAESCIETTARHRFRDLTQSALRGDNLDDATMQEIDLLRRFLESADFPGLRTASESALREGRDVTFQIFETGGEVTCRMDVV
ncbi:MAG: hypothetical protein KAQ74_06785 [Dehalococcoidia bacterium]|nr:hypothetical protein [Dehalococcoidia bacterium]